MKRLLVIGLTTLLFVGCQVTSVLKDTLSPEPETYWLNYYPTQCNEKPWGDTLEETTITTYYQDLGVTIDTIEVNAPPSGFFSCAACGCSTGIQVSIQTDAAGKAILLEHGFTEEELVNVLDEDDDTTTEPVEVNETNTNLGVPSDIVETEDGSLDIELSAEDAGLQERAGIVQSALTDYYTKNASYPDSLDELGITVDTGGLTYTPIGVTPADYYDLSVEYSTGKEVLNP